MENDKKAESSGFVVYHDEYTGVFEHLADQEIGELFRALFHYTRNGENPASFQSGVVAIVYDVLKACAGMRRNEALWATAPPEIPEERKTEDEEQNAQLDRIANGVEHLTENQKYAFQAYFLDGMTMEAIALKTGKTRGQIRDYLNGGRAKLLRYLEQRI